MQAKYVALEYFLYFLLFSRAKSCCLIHAVWGMCQTFLKCLKATSMYSPSSFPILTVTDMGS